MGSERAQIDADEIFGSFQDDWHLQNKKDGFETRWEWPMETGSGSIYMIKLRPGLSMGISDFRLMEKAPIRFSNINLPLIFNFGISGTMRTRIDQAEGCRDFFSFKPGFGSVNYLPHWNEGISLPMVTTLKWIMIHMEPHLLETVVASNPEQIPAVLYEISTGAKEKSYCRILPMDASINMVIGQILDCPYQGFLKRLYLESKALELISHSLARQVLPETHKDKPFSLRPQEFERVAYARELVERDLQNPPKLLDLARTVGMPHTKLNYGFREVYGATIFDYLRQIRLKKARILLDQGRMNVSEVAYAVGYSSLSHFAKSFKDYHGTAPGNYMRKVLRAGVRTPSCLNPANIEPT